MAHAAQHQAAAMTQNDLDAIASRESYCAPFETRVSLSGVERDQLVELARGGMLLREKFTSGNAIPVERVTVRADEMAKEEA